MTKLASIWTILLLLAFQCLPIDGYIKPVYLSRGTTYDRNQKVYLPYSMPSIASNGDLHQKMNLVLKQSSSSEGTFLSKKQIPNMLTISRVVAIPVFILAFLMKLVYIYLYISDYRLCTINCDNPPFFL